VEMLGVLGMVLGGLLLFIWLKRYHDQRMIAYRNEVCHLEGECANLRVDLEKSKIKIESLDEELEELDRSRVIEDDNKQIIGCLHKWDQAESAECLPIIREISRHDFDGETLDDTKFVTIKRSLYICRICGAIFVFNQHQFLPEEDRMPTIEAFGSTGISESMPMSIADCEGASELRPPQRGRLMIEEPGKENESDATNV